MFARLGAAIAAALLVSLARAQSLDGLAGGYKLSIALGSSRSELGICIPDAIGGDLLLAASTTSSIDGNSALYTRARVTNVTFAARSYVAIETSGCTIRGFVADDTIAQRPCAQDDIPDPSCFYLRDTGTGIIAFGALEAQVNATCPSSSGVFALNFIGDGSVCAELNGAASASAGAAALLAAAVLAVAASLGSG